MADTKLSALSTVSALGPDGLLYASTGGASRAIAAGDLFAGVPAAVGIAPASGFGTGAGGTLLSADVGPLNAEAPPFRLTARAYEQGGGAEPDNVAWRWGVGLREDGFAGVAEGWESGFSMVVESSYFTGGIHQGEAYWEVFGGDGAGGTESCRPIFCTWDNADVSATVGLSVLAGAFSVAEPGASASFFTMNRRFGSYGVALEALNQYFAVQGDTAFGAEPTKGQLRFYGYADSTKKMKIGWHGGGGAAFAIAGEAPGGSPDQNPTVMYLSVGGGFSSYLALRRLTGTDSNTAFGFGITPSASADNNAVHFVGYLNLAEIAAPGDPAANNGRLYVDDNGDLVAKINHGGTTKTVVVVDWSAAA
jgi:hypothetical protein